MLIKSVVLALVGYFVLIYLTTNLVGMVVRGFFRNSEMEKMKKDTDTHELIKKEIRKSDRADNVITIIFVGVSLVFLYLLYEYINIWAVLAAVLLMFSRIPDLLWEIRHGRKVTAHERPRGGIYSLTDATTWGALPALFWAFYSN